MAIHDMIHELLLLSNWRKLVMFFGLDASLGLFGS